MTFTTNIFLIGLLPWFILACLLLKNVRYSKLVLIMLANSLFYAWGGVGAFIFICFFTLLVYLLGILFRHTNNRLVFSIGIGLILLPLILVKYLTFVISNINAICHMNLNTVSLLMPIGISFFTFEAISYLCDIFKGKIKKGASIFEIYSYLTFFPTVTSGPILRFEDFRKGFFASIELDAYNEAIERILLGLCKKVLIADKLALLADYYFDGVAAGNTYSSFGLWIGSIAYSLQLYFDFSGYSEMAIGFGKLLGFEIGENFNKPYQASSISDFWKRWHISLTKWFRDYVYIPLGGNRCRVSRHLLNMLIVWLLTGFWHGADWSFILWGLGYFVLLSLEKYLSCMKKFANGIWGHIYTLFFVNLLWIPFRAASLHSAGKYIAGMLGIGSSGYVEEIAVHYIPYIIVALALCFPLNKVIDRFKGEKWFEIVKGLIILCFTALAICAVVDASYTPYIYGNF